MTHDKIKALDKLIAAAESGTVISMNAREVCHCLGWKFPDMRVRWLLSSEIGSLDAAKTLHEALLPGWRLWALGEEDETSCGWTAMILKRQNRDVGVRVFNQPNPARAWLIAILKAYRAKMEGSE